MFACEVNRGVVTFTQLQQPVDKRSLKSDKCYLLIYKDLLLARRGKRWKGGMTSMDAANNFISQFHSWKSESDFIISLVMEGSEGETFWKWFDMQGEPVEVEEETPLPTAKAPTRQDVAELLAKASEIISDKLEQTEEHAIAEVVVSETAASQPPPPAQSQEATSENVVGEQEEQSSQLVEGEQNEVSEEKKEEEDSSNKQESRMSPQRLSLAIEGLSDITKELSQVLQRSSVNIQDNTEVAAAPQEAEVDTNDAPPTEKSTPSLEEGKNLSTTEEAVAEAEAEVQADKQTEVKHQTVEQEPEIPTLSVIVEIAEGPSKGVYEVTVKEKSPVIVVLFKVARLSGFSLKTTSAIFEVCESLRIQCPLEDHELIKDVMARWPSKNPPKLVLKDFASKNILWSISPPIPKEAIKAFAKEGTVPEVSSDLLYSAKQGRSKKMKWKQAGHCLKGVGVYSVGHSRKGGDKLELSASLDHRLYTPIITSLKDADLPNKYCFILKPPLSWKEKELKFYCAGDFMAMARWVHGIRLVKYGLQLKSNYTAMRGRLKKVDVTKP